MREQEVINNVRKKKSISPLGRWTIITFILCLLSFAAGFYFFTHPDLSVSLSAMSAPFGKLLSKQSPVTLPLVSGQSFAPLINISKSQSPQWTLLKHSGVEATNFNVTITQNSTHVTFCVIPKGTLTISDPNITSLKLYSGLNGSILKDITSNVTITKQGTTVKTVCATIPNSLADYLRFGNTSSIIIDELQQKAIFDAGNGVIINMTLYKWINNQWNNQNNISVYFNNVSWKAEATDPNANNINWDLYKWVIDSTGSYVRRGKYFDYEKNNQVYSLEFGADCNKIQFNITNSSQVLNDANCRYNLISPTQFEVIFNSNGSIDPIITGDVTYNSTDTNITQEFGWAHLNISTTAPYDSLVGYWSFDRDNSTRAYDLTRNNNDGTYTSPAAGNGSGYYDNSYNNPSTSSGVLTMASSTSLNLDNKNFSISFWVKVGSYGNGPGLFQKKTAPIPGSCLRGLLDTADRLVFGFECGGSDLVSPVGAITTNKWTFLTFTFNNNTLKREIWVNGTLFATDTSGNRPNATDGTVLEIGRYFYRDGENLNGSIDDLMVFTTVLNSSQISGIYNNQSSRFLPSGEQLFQNINLGTNNTVNVTLSGYETTLNSNLSIKFNSGAYQYFINGNVSNYSLTGLGSATNLNMTIRYEAENGTSPTVNPFYTPIVAGNITITGYSLVFDVAPTVNLISPINYTRATTSLNYFIANHTDDIALIGTNLTIWNSTSQVGINATVITGLNNLTNLSFTFPREDIYTWNYNTFDNGGFNSWNSTNWTLIYDVTNPIINLVAPVNNTLTTSTTHSFNSTFTDNVQLVNSTFYLWNSTNDLINTTAQSKTATSGGMNLSVTLPYNGVFKWNYQVCDIGNNCGFNNTNFTITYDNVNPKVYLISPANASTVAAIVYFIANHTDNINLKNTTLNVWNNTGSLILTNSTTISNTLNTTNLSITLPYLGNFTWNYQTFDIVGNSAFNSTNFTITYADGIAPNIQFVSPTETNNSQLNRTYIDVNVTASDDQSLSSITINLYNTTGLVNTTSQATSPFYIRFLNLQDGIYYFNATANDAALNTNRTQTRTVLIDTTNPTASYVSPTHTSGNILYTNKIKVNITATDAGGGIQSIVIRLYNGSHTLLYTNTSATSPYYIEYPNLVANGNRYFFNTTINDTLNNLVNLATRNVTLDTTPINFTTPLNSTSHTTGVLSTAANTFNGETANWTYRYLTTWYIPAGNPQQSFSDSQIVAAGTYNWTINATDVEGNIAQWTEYDVVVSAAGGGGSICGVASSVNRVNATTIHFGASSWDSSGAKTTYTLTGLCRNSSQATITFPTFTTLATGTYESFYNIVDGGTCEIRASGQSCSVANVAWYSYFGNQSTTPTPAVIISINYTLTLGYNIDYSGSDARLTFNYGDGE